MNYLDAHKIVTEYLYALSCGGEDVAWGLRPRKLLPYDFDKDKFIDAYKLYLAHTYFFGHRSIEEVNALKFSRYGLETFVDDDLYHNVTKCFSIVNDKGIFAKIKYGDLYDQMKNLSSHYIAMSKEKLVSNYRGKEVEDFDDFALNKSIEYRVRISEAFKNDEPDQYDVYYDCLEDYCNDIYDYLGWYRSLTDLYTFTLFGTMKKYLQRDDMKKYFIGYEDYIMSHND